MSVEGNPFRWVPSLKHIATVGTIQMLWRNSKHKEVIKNLNNSPALDKESYLEEWNKIRISMIQHLGIAIDKLSVPEVMKNYLKSFLIPMVREPLSYLCGSRLSEDWIEMLTYFVDNLTWKDIGYVDVETMLKSYVSNKETIDFVVWYKLCRYCLEDDIIRLAGTIDWDNCTEQFNSSHYSIYWYHKIYGTFPTEKMFKSGGHFDLFEENFSSGMYNNEDIAKKMFVECFHNECATISAIKYFRNLLKDEELNGLVPDNEPFFISDKVAVYFLRTEPFDGPLMEFIKEYNPFVMEDLVKWPWILFIDNWIKGFENVRSSLFLNSFREMVTKIYRDDHPSEKPMSQSVYTTKLYDSFRKLWMLFYRRFGAQDKTVHKALKIVLERKDFVLCKLMFEGVESNQKRIFIRVLKDYVQKCSKWDLHRELSTQFAKDVLENEGERNSFWEIWNQ